LGQHVFNTLFIGKGISCARLFYCENGEFWSIIFDFVEIVYAPEALKKPENLQKIREGLTDEDIVPFERSEN
jgi:hypothetical protein